MALDAAISWETSSISGSDVCKSSCGALIGQSDNQLSGSGGEQDVAEEYCNYFNCSSLYGENDEKELIVLICPKLCVEIVPMTALSTLLF